MPQKADLTKDAEARDLVDKEPTPIHPYWMYPLLLKEPLGAPSREYLFIYLFNGSWKRQKNWGPLSGSLLKSERPEDYSGVFTLLGDNLIHQGTVL
jgi:hypothetical protein